MVSSSAAFLPGRVGLLSLSLAVTGPLYFLSRLTAAVLRVEPRAFGRFREAFYWPRPQLRSQRPHHFPPATPSGRGPGAPSVRKARAWVKEAFALPCGR